MKKIGKFLKFIDIFGRKTEITVQKEPKYNTKIGGFFTLVLFCLSILLFFNFGSDMIFRQNPTSIYSEVFQQIPEATYFSQESFFFMFGIEAPDYNHFIDETYYTAKVNNIFIHKNGTQISIEVPIEKCSEAHLPSNPQLYSYFESASGSPISRLYCIKKGLDDTFFLAGSFDADLYVYVDIIIEICHNSTNDSYPVCKPFEEIQKKMSGYYAFYTMDYLIDPQDYENPGKGIGKDYFSPISVGFIRNTNRYIGTTNVNSDDGFTDFIYSSSSFKKYPNYVNDKETLLMDSLDSGVLVQFRLRKDHNIMIYDRSYKKFENVLAEIGGFIQMMYLISFLFTYPFVSKLYFEKIINSIYNFEIADELRRSLSQKNKTNSFTNKSIMSNKNLKELKPSKSIPIRQNHFEMMTNILSQKKSLSKSQSIKKKIDHKTSLKQNERVLKYMINIQNMTPLKTSFWEFFKGAFTSLMSCINKKALKYQQLEVGITALSEKLDISNILKKFYEIDKLKMLLLDNDQYNLFEYLPKPVILKNNKIDLSYSSSINEKQKSFKFITYDNNMAAKARKTYSAYQKIINKINLTEIDKKLIDLMDENIKEILTVNKIFDNINF